MKKSVLGIFIFGILLIGMIGVVVAETNSTQGNPGSNSSQGNTSSNTTQSCGDGICTADEKAVICVEATYSNGSTMSGAGCWMTCAQDCEPIVCSAPNCVGAYQTGKFDSNGCPIYSCPPKCEKDSDCSKSCAGGTEKCSVQKCINGLCVSGTTPGGGDIDICLDDSNNYWDQETNKCYSGYSKEIILQLCKDPDGGSNYFEGAHTFGFRSYSSAEDSSRDLRIRTGGKDYCGDGKLIEHYCDEKGYIQTTYYDCPNGSKGCANDGACVMGEPISEKITCKFEDTKKEQQCYLAGSWTPADEGTKWCKADSGPGSCVISYSGYKGEKVTWKSTCGGYQYTTQDGNDEVIYFKCTEGETNISQIENKGFMYSYYQCYDGFEGKQGSESSCKPSDVWHKYAKEACEGHCYKDNSKCGVNTFSVSGECYLEEPSCSILNCVNSYYDYEANECKCGEENPTCKSDSDCPQPSCSIIDGVTFCPGLNKCINGQCKIEEETLVCKDSCPFEGKCYPMTYRKDGKYCSGSGSFEPQLEGNAACDNNFECKSNVCVGGQCVSQGLLEKIMSWFKRMFGGQ
ncbi:hypothetical protein J4218_00015 [Candidatus Pacearchaeota archaeon]|nr:hypothetical protein [Candidatus Pacearchaeota archaeon]